MYNLIRFIQKHFSVILFLIIEVGCVILLASSLGFHRQVIFNVTNDAVGWVYEIGSDVGDYFRLKKTNKQLAEENAKLHERLAYGTDTCNEELHVSDSNCIYKFIPAKVVNNSISQTNNYITINKGRTDGVEKDMGVISTDGIVGIVADVSRHYATIISLLHNYSVTSVRLTNIWPISDGKPIISVTERLKIFPPILCSIKEILLSQARSPMFSQKT